MARLLGPVGADRAVFLPSGAPAIGRLGVAYASETGSTLADILTYQSGTPGTPGAAIAGSTVTVDGYGLLPRFWFPDGLVSRIWVSVNGGPRFPVDADYNPRIDSIVTQVGNATIDVRQPAYGATGDGVTSDTAAIQAAMQAAATYGAWVYLPRGTYLVEPDATYKVCLRLPAGFKGFIGSGGATIKVKSGVGDYNAIIANFSSLGGGYTATNVDGIVIRDITIDQNTTGNVVTDPSFPGPLFHGYPRFAITINGGMTNGTATIDRVRIVDTDGVNTIQCLARDITIRDCELMVSALSSDHDHSAIYTNNNTVGGSAVITGCRISSPASGTLGARTAIETHGGTQYVAGNTVRNYFKGGNLTGVEVYPGQGVRWVGNSFVNVRYGIQLWSLVYSTNSGPYGLRNVHIRHNTFRLDPAGWTPTGATDVRAIFLDSTTGYTLPFCDIHICDNDISTVPGHVGNVGDSAAHAIDWRRTVAPLNGLHDRNIVVTGNTIDSPTASGIRVATVAGDLIDGLTLTDNRIRNAGQGTTPAGGALSTGYGNGIMVTGALTNSRITDNEIRDDQTTCTTNVGLYLAPTVTGGARNVITGNRVGPVNSAKYLFSTTIDGGYLLRGDVDTWVQPTGIVALASELRALDTGLTWRQGGTPNGNTWTSYAPGVSDAAVDVASARTIGVGPLQAASGNDARFSVVAPLPRRPGTSGSWAVLTGRPLVMPGTGSGTLAVNSWRYIPFKLDADWAVDALAVITTVAASGTGGFTASLIFGLFACDANGRPAARQADYSSYGSIDLTQAPGALQLATAGLVLPGGEWFLGCGWSGAGTATTSPILTTVAGVHPQISSSGILTAMSAYLQAVSGATVPATAVANAAAATAPLVHVKLH